MNNQFSKNLKKIRKDNNLSQEQLADELGVSRQAISKWESAQAYPEMDKIITLCNKFDLNIDDLLNKDIKEVKGEEESKKKLNNYINDFLKFVSDSINMFVNMAFKSKLKCIIEQLFIIFILFILSNIFISIGTSIFNQIFTLLPDSVCYILSNIVHSIFSIICILASIVIWSYIFKTRYLNYYLDMKNNKVDDSKEEITKEKDSNSNDRIVLNKKDNKIVIRDPEHSEYKFINGIVKFAIVIIKFFLFWLALGIAFNLIGLFIGFILSFMLYKTGVFFIGILLATLAASCICVDLLLLIFNFMFNRKNEKKKMIWCFIISLVVFGIGCGLIALGALNFDVVELNEDMYKTVSFEYDMQEGLMVNPNTQINYVVEERDNVKVEYTIIKYFELDSHIGGNSSIIYGWSYSNNPLKIAREVIKNANNRKLVPIDSGVQKITIFASSSNIETIKNNIDNYNMNKESNNELIESYEEKISDLEEENKELNNKIDELQKEENK